MVRKISFISKLFATDKQEENKKETIVERVDNEKRDYSSIYKSTYIDKDFLSFNIGDKREKAMCYNMDNVLKKIKDEIFKLPLLARAILNITAKASDKPIKFIGSNPEEVKKVATEFNLILKRSNYNPNLFLKEAFQNLVKYSNVFIMPIRKNSAIDRLKIIQNKGWTVDKKFGNSFCETFILSEDGYDGFGVIYKDRKFKNGVEIFHYTYNKESDEIFAMPIWCSVIPVIQKYNLLMDNALESYADQRITRIIYELGITKSGQVRQIKTDSYNSAKALLEQTDDDLIFDIPVNINKVEKEFKSPDKLLEALEIQMYAGLYTSKGQLGSTSSGRQDAETQDENTLLITNSFLKELEFQINKTIVHNICLDLFKVDKDIEIKFTDDFNVKERKEKHAVFLFQGGVITIDEARELCSMDEKFDIEKTFQKLYEQEEMNGNVENVNNPKNQHTGGTGTTKKTKKD